MPDVVESVRSYLLDFVTIRNLVGQRISTDKFRQGEKLPCIVITRIYTNHEHTLSNLAGLAHARIQFDCLAATRGVANTIAEAIRRTGIIGFRGDMHGTEVRGVRLEEGQRYYTDAPIDASDDYRYAVNFDLVVDYNEEII
jgi:hypothetical protein